MAITASEITTSNTLEQLRTEFNSLVTDVTGLESGTLAHTEINTTTISATTFNLNEDGTFVFEGATSDAYETTLTVADPTADRTITLPNETGTVLTDASSINATTFTVSANNSTNETVYPLFVDGATGAQGAESDTGLSYNPSTELLTVGKLLLDDGATIGVASSTSAITVASTGIVTFVDDILIKDDGTIGSASATTAIAISSAGVVALAATTEASATGTAALTVAGGIGVAKDVWIGDDLVLDSDATVISFGDNQDVTLTHVHDTGLLLNSTMAIQFNDSSQYINAPSNAILDINATDEIELNATLADVNANLDVSGTGTFGGILKTDDATEATSTTDGSLQTDGGLSVVKDAVFGDDVKLLSDASVLSFGADSDVIFTHVADTGVLLNSTMAIQFNDSSQYINAPSNAILDINATDEIELNATLADVNANLDVSGTYQGGGTMTTGGNIVIPDAGNIGSASATTAMAISSAGVVALAATTEASATGTAALTVAGGIGVAKDMWIGDDIVMDSDSAVLKMGADQDVTLTHSADIGLTLLATGDNDTSLILKSTAAPSGAAPNLYLTRTSASPADDSLLGNIVYNADNSAAENTTFAQIYATSLDVTNGTEDGNLIFQTVENGSYISSLKLQGSLITVNGAITAAAGGTAALPAHAITTGAIGVNGIYVAAANTLGFSTAATERMKIDVNGKCTLTTAGSGFIVPDGGNFGTATTPTAIDIISTGEVGIGQTAQTSIQLYAYDNTTNHYAGRFQLDNASSGYTCLYATTDGSGPAMYGHTAGAHYGLQATSDNLYGCYGRTLHASYGGVVGYSQNNAIYGILAHTNTYTLYGNGVALASGGHTTSDERLKDIQSRISSSDGILAKIKQLKPTYFTWKPDSDQADITGEQIGLIAQEVEPIFPHLVLNNPVPQMDEMPVAEGDDDAIMMEDGSYQQREKTLNESLENTKSVAYEKLVCYLVAAIQELEARVASLE